MAQPQPQALALATLGINNGADGLFLFLGVTALWRRAAVLGRGSHSGRACHKHRRSGHRRIRDTGPYLRMRDAPHFHRRSSSSGRWRAGGTKGFSSLMVKRRSPTSRSALCGSQLVLRDSSRS